MKKSCLAIGLLALTFLAAGPLAAQSAPVPGQTREGFRFSSSILSRDVAYAVYLPPDYTTSSRRYPVVYLLHGYSDDESGWVQFGEIQQAVDRAIADRTIPPMIIVMPDGGVTWYINDYLGKVRFEDMFVQEFIPHIDATFRTRAKMEFRGVAGLSMGGWGALMFALRHPDLFAACAAFSAAIWTDADAAATPDDQYNRMFAGLFGPRPTGKDAGPTETFKKYNALNLAQTMPEAVLQKTRLYIDCGDDDFLLSGNMALQNILTSRKVPHEFRVRDGGHTWTYWRTGIVDGLAFIGRSFQR